MFKYLYKLVYGKKDAAIENLVQEIINHQKTLVFYEQQNTTLGKKNSALQKMNGGLREVIDRIERNIEPIDSVDLLRHKIMTTDKDYIEVVTALGPTIRSPGLNDVTDGNAPRPKRHTLTLEKAFVSEILDDEFKNFDDVQHEVVYKLARFIGHQVTENIMRDAGWRV